MGRPKKQKAEADEESRLFTERAIRTYSEMKRFCEGFEQKRAELIKASGIHPELFRAECYPSEGMLAAPDVTESDASAAENYLGAKESVYLLEHGIVKLTGRTREIAEDLFLHGGSWEEVCEKRNISRMTVSRERKKAIEEISLEVGAFMKWKARHMFF